MTVNDYERQPMEGITLDDTMNGVQSKHDNRRIIDRKWALDGFYVDESMNTYSNLEAYAYTARLRLALRTPIELRRKLKSKDAKAFTIYSIIFAFVMGNIMIRFKRIVHNRYETEDKVPHHNGESLFAIGECIGTKITS